ncbi:hypothetical protein D3C86_1942700 [compost metagenome]
MPTHRIKHEVRVSQDHRVVETQHRIARLRQPGVPVRVRFLAQAMDTAVGLNNQLQDMAGEVRDIGTDRNLPSELDAVQSPIPQQGPERGFGRGQRPT